MLKKIKGKLLFRDNSNEGLELNNIKLKYDDLVKENLTLSNEINKLIVEFDDFKKYAMERFDSNHEIFSLLLLDYELKPKGSLLNVQLLSQELLNFIVNICNSYDLEYWLDFGTLLGAIRHESYIPWDDDIDLGMMRCDVKKFLEIIPKELEQYGLEDTIQVNIDRINVNGDNIGFIQLFYFDPYKKDILSTLDIFTYDYIKSFDDSTKEIFYNEQHIFHRMIKEGSSRPEAEKHYFERLNISNEKCDYIIPGIDGYRNEYTYGFDLLETNKIFPLKKIKFNGLEYACPNDCRYYLQSIYDDFEQIPIKIRHHNRAMFLKKIENINYIFEKEILRIKEINENFK